MDPMHDDTMFSAILHNTYTRADFYRRVDFLRELLEHYFFDPVARESGRTHVIRTYRDGGIEAGQSDREAIIAWGEDTLNMLDAGNMHERIKELKHAAAALPKFVLYVPVHLSPANISMLGIWCREHLRPDILLDVHIDPSTTGGCAFADSSSYHDFSLSYFLRKERPSLMKLIRQYGE